MTDETVQEKKRVRLPTDPGSIEAAQSRHTGESGKDNERDVHAPRQYPVDPPPVAKPSR